MARGSKRAVGSRCQVVFGPSSPRRRKGVLSLEASFSFPLYPIDAA